MTVRVRITKSQRAWLSNIIQTPGVRREHAAMVALINRYARSNRARAQMLTALYSYVDRVRDTTYRKAVQR